MIALAVAVAVAVAAHTATVSVVGEAPVTEGDPALTERDAKRDARRNALRAAPRTSILRRNFDNADELLSTLTVSPIRTETWGALAPGTAANTRTIALTAIVDVDALDDAACTVLRANHEPAIAVAFAGDATLPAADVAAAFASACFTVTSFQAGADDVDAHDAGGIKHASAQRWVTAATTTPPTPPRGPWPQHLVVGSAAKRSVVLVNLYSGEIDAAGFVEKLRPDGTSWVDDFVKKIAMCWCTDCCGFSSGKVQLVVKSDGDVKITADVAAGIVDFIIANLHAATNEPTVFFVGAAAAPPKVLVRDTKPTVASFDVEIDGAAEMLATRLDEQRVGPKKNVVEIIEVSRGKVIAKLHPAGWKSATSPK